MVLCLNAVLVAAVWTGGMLWLAAPVNRASLIVALGAGILAGFAWLEEQAARSRKQKPARTTSWWPAAIAVRSRAVARHTAPQ